MAEFSDSMKLSKEYLAAHHAATTKLLTPFDQKRLHEMALPRAGGRMKASSGAIPGGGFPMPAGPAGNLGPLVGPSSVTLSEDGAGGHATATTPITGPSPESVELYVPICKADDEHRIITGMVLVPGWEDSQGDVIGAEDIEKAAHEFLADYNAAGNQHVGDALDGITVVESYTAPVDLVMKDMIGRDVPIPKGTWLMSQHIAPGTVDMHGEDMWQGVKAGKWTGFSIQGEAFRAPLT